MYKNYFFSGFVRSEKELACLIAVSAFSQWRRIKLCLSNPGIQKGIKFLKSLQIWELPIWL
jgi:hypothetical protein